MWDFSECVIVIVIVQSEHEKQHERGEDKPDHVERQVSTEATRQMQEDEDCNDKRREKTWFKSVFSVFLMCFLLVSHVVFVVSLVFFFLVFLLAYPFVLSVFCRCCFNGSPIVCSLLPARFS